MEGLFFKRIVLYSLQFDKVWASLPTNDFGNLDYKEFLRRYSSNMEIPPTQRPASTINGRPGTQMSGRRLQSRAMSRSITQVRSLTRERVYLYSAMYPALASIVKLLSYVCDYLFLLTDGIWPSWISIISSSVSYEYAADQCRECRGQDQEPDIPELEGNPEELS